MNRCVNAMEQERRPLCGISCTPGEGKVLFKDGSKIRGSEEIKPNFIVYDQDFVRLKLLGCIFSL